MKNKPVKQIEKMLGIPSQPVMMYVILHTHRQGHETYVFSSREKRAAGMKLLKKINKDDIDAGNDFLDESDEVLDYEIQG